MNGIREWAVLLCSVSVGSAFIVFLVPDGNMKKSVNFVVSLFLLSVVIIPVFGKDAIEIKFPDVSVDKFPSEEDYRLEYSQFLIQNSKNVVETHIAEILEDICKNDFIINASVVENSDGDIVVSEIFITISEEDSYYTEVIKSHVKNLTGLIPQVVIDS